MKFKRTFLPTSKHLPTSQTRNALTIDVHARHNDGHCSSSSLSKAPRVSPRDNVNRRAPTSEYRNYVDVNITTGGTSNIRTRADTFIDNGFTSDAFKSQMR